ncbi:alpha/beta fold hydrolase [Paraburkholderia sp. DHOC27]|uniref:alpha/beta fold hydrolase n=1 Tax=Paraburkholderia sp. DHOC27 TaxID=2303330 RepID=UPI000E3E6214|nr:alpha/beta hydrolase [Paraburkholderia sp. DHOC27]RFU48285.1 alpha/beta hydrolase [Paraburkholderia sp. DHOC27]
MKFRLPESANVVPARKTRVLRHLLARVLVCVGLVAAQSTVIVHAAPVAYQPDMLCGADMPRPDRGAVGNEQVLRTPHGSIGYYRFGQGSPIVMITGYRATIANWNAYFLGALAKHHEVIVFDNRGIGKSSAVNADYRIKDLAGDSATLISALKLKDPTVVGWSMGGMIAQQLALDHPSLVGRLVLMSTMPPGPRAVAVPHDVENILSGGSGATFARVMDVLFPANVEQEANACFRQDMFIPAGYSVPSIPADVTTAQQKLMQRWKLDDHAYARLSKLTVPTLALVGTDDEVLQPDNTVVLSHVVPQATLVEVKDAGHAMMYQYPRQLAARIDTFIEGTPPVEASIKAVPRHHATARVAPVSALCRSDCAATHQ